MLNKILNIYLFLPFVVAFLSGISFFIKKASTFNNIAKIYAVINLFFSSLFLFKLKMSSFSFNIFNLNFEYNNISSVFLIVANFIFLVFIFACKDNVLKLNRLFYTTLITLNGLAVLLILSNNIFVNFGIIFWFLIVYFLVTYSFLENKEKKKNLKIQLINDLIFYFIAVFLICFDFIRFFIENNVAFNFSNIAENLYYISATSSTLAFFGFLIIVFRLLNFAFISFKTIGNLKYLNNFMASFMLILSISFGYLLLFKIFFSFSELFSQYQNIICIYCIVNFIYLIILSIKEKNLITFCAYNLCSYIAITILILFSNLKNAPDLALYYFVALIISYLLAFLVCILLENRMKIKNIDEFKKLKQENKKLKPLILFAFLNISNTPFLGLFTPFLISVLIVFSTNYNSAIVNYLIYILLLGCFISGCNILNILNKILIEPVDYVESKIELSKVQIFIFTVLILIIFLLGFGCIGVA